MYVCTLTPYCVVEVIVTFVRLPVIRSNNPVILHFLLFLAGSLSCPLVQELTTKALAACPDVLLPYFKALTLNFDPQPTAQWMESTEFMIKVRVYL